MYCMSKNIKSDVFAFICNVIIGLTSQILTDNFQYHSVRWYILTIFFAENKWQMYKVPKTIHVLYVHKSSNPIDFISIFREMLSNASFVIYKYCIIMNSKIPYFSWLKNFVVFALREVLFINTICKNCLCSLNTVRAWSNI